jgi:hypothetical protein
MLAQVAQILIENWIKQRSCIPQIQAKFFTLQAGDVVEINDSNAKMILMEEPHADILIENINQQIYDKQLLTNTEYDIVFDSVTIKNRGVVAREVKFLQVVF